MLAGQDLGDKEYVMDVRLKREYMSGYIFNAEAGGGTADRYLGRLFRHVVHNALAPDARRSDKQSQRLAHPRTERLWWSVTHTPGDFRTKMAGLDYYVSARDDKSWNFPVIPPPNTPVRTTSPPPTSPTSSPRVTPTTTDSHTPLATISH